MELCFGFLLEWMLLCCLGFGFVLLVAVVSGLCYGLQVAVVICDLFVVLASLFWGLLCYMACSFRVSCC